MADQKISARTEATSLAGDDLLAAVDVSDTTMAPTGTDKKVQRDNIFPSWTPHNAGPASAMAFAPASTATGAANTFYAVLVRVLAPATLTGVRYRTGTGAASGNVRCALYDSTGATRLANRSTDAAQAGANLHQNVAFDSTYSAAPGSYYALVWFSSATATCQQAAFLTGLAAGTNAGGTPTTITPAVGATLVAVMGTY